MNPLRNWLLLSALCASFASASVPVFADDAPATPPAKTAPEASPAPQAAPAAPAQTPAPAAPAPQAQTPAPGAPEAGPAIGSKVDLADLLAPVSPDAAPDVPLGDANAPVTIVEYHSMTCPHCAHFEETVLPALTDKYIKTGKVRLIMRSFPLNQLDAVAFMLLRCQPKDKYLDNIKYMYDTQATWAYSDKPKEAITALATKLGFTQDSFNTCLHDEHVWDGLMAVAKKAEETFKVDGTPTFFINGTLEGSISTVDELDQKLKDFVKN
jgi:protein-disulfide isomerase